MIGNFQCNEWLLGEVCIVKDKLKYWRRNCVVGENYIRENQIDFQPVLAWIPNGRRFWDQAGIYGNHFTVQIGFECHQFNLNATTPPNKARFTLLEAWISSWNFESLNINNLSWWDGGHLLVEYQPKNIVLHLVNWQERDSIKTITDYVPLRREIFFIDICVDILYFWQVMNTLILKWI